LHNWIQEIIWSAFRSDTPTYTPNNGQISNIIVWANHNRNGISVVIDYAARSNHLLGYMLS